MGYAVRFLLMILTVVVALAFQAIYRAVKVNPVPKFDLEKYWGPGKPIPDNPEIKKFEINFGINVRILQIVKFIFGFNDRI